MNSASDRLVAVVGRDNVLYDEKTLKAYEADQSFVAPMLPQCLVRPRDVAEVQEIIKWANETRTPLVPVSSGPPHFHGGTVPGAARAVMVDLAGMNRIRRIDRKNRMAVIEPGVTYGQLQQELAGQGLSVSTPLLPRASKSVVASLLERQPTLVPKYNWTLPEPLRCLEITWGNGESMWTGEAGLKVHSLEKQWEAGFAQMSPMGPDATDWHRLVSAAQGSMGIVTWASLKCELLPKVHKLFFIPAEDLPSLIDCAYRLVRLRLGDEFLLLNGSLLASVIGEGPARIKSLKKSLPPWVIIVAFAGRDILPEEKVEMQAKDAEDVVRQFGLRMVPSIPDVSGTDMLKTLLRPSRQPYWKLDYKGGSQDIFFLTTLDKTPGFIRTMRAVAGELGYPPEDTGIYLQPQHQGVACHCEFVLPFAPGDAGEAARVKELFARASERMIDQGAFFSRPYGLWAKMVYSRNAQGANLLKEIKEIFDPNHVLNPGKLCF